MIQSQELFLMKKQSTLAYSYAVASAASLAGTDVIEVLKGSTLDKDQPVDEVETVAGIIDQDAAVPGGKQAKVKLTIPMAPALPSGATAGKVQPYFGKALEAMCGMSVAQQTTATTDRFTYTFLSEPTAAGIIASYTGATGTNAAIKEVAYNVLSDFSLKFQAGKRVDLEFNGSGAYVDPVDATQPSITKGRISPVAFKNATIQILGSSAYKLISAEINANIGVSSRVDPSEYNSTGQSDITNRKVKFKARCYMLTLATVNPQTAVDAQTEGALSLKWGSGSTAIQVLANYAQFTMNKKSDENGITVWDIEGQCNRNDLSIIVNPA